MPERQSSPGQIDCEGLEEREVVRDFSEAVAKCWAGQGSDDDFDGYFALCCFNEMGAVSNSVENSGRDENIAASSLA